MPDELPSEKNVLRLLTRARDINKASGHCAAIAFIRRPRPADPNGLSVYYDCEPTEAAKASPLSGVRAAAKLRVADVRAIRCEDAPDACLDVVPDEDAKDSDPPRHANITGTPYEEDDLGLANFFARRLVEAAGKVVRISS